MKRNQGLATTILKPADTLGLSIVGVRLPQPLVWKNQRSLCSSTPKSLF